MGDSETDWCHSGKSLVIFTQHIRLRKAKKLFLRWFSRTLYVAWMLATQPPPAIFPTRNMLLHHEKCEIE